MVRSDLEHINTFRGMYKWKHELIPHFFVPTLDKWSIILSHIEHKPEENLKMVAYPVAKLKIREATTKHVDRLF